MARLHLACLAILITPAAAWAACAPLQLPPAGSRRSDIVTAVMPAVVQVQARFGPDTNESYEEILGDAIRETQASNRQSLGSGFIVSGDGLVVTNEHVVAQATQITVRLADGSTRGATLIGSDERTDIALLRMEALSRCYPALTWGDSDKIRVGENITAVGSPFGLGGSVSAGIVSGRGRSLGAGPFHDFVQIDAAINQGNSGGPLLDESGRVVGINTAILAPAGGNIGIGFSLPAAMAQRVIAELFLHGRTSRTQLGLSMEDLTGDVAEALGLSSNRGVLVNNVVSGSPADRAGMMAADVVLAVDGRPVGNLGALSAEVATFAAGRKVQLDVWRDGGPISVGLVPAAKPDAAGRAKELLAVAVPGSIVSHAGLQLAGTTNSMNEVAGQNGASGGLIVVAVAPESPGAARGIAVGDIIVGLAGKPLTSTVQFTDAIAAARAVGKRNILITLLHGKNTAWMALPVNPKE
jgi:serine protease Do